MLISGHVTPRQAPTSAHTESLGSLLSQVAAHVQGSGPLLKLASAATHGQGMPASTLAPKAGAELEPQPAKKVVTQQGSLLPVISAGMLWQQIRHLQALQKHQQGARSGSMPLPALPPAASAKHASCQQSAGAIALEQAGHSVAHPQQPRQSTGERRSVLPAHADGSLSQLPELHPSTVPSRHASQQPASHSLRHPASGAVAQVSAQGAHASAAQGLAASAVPCDSGQMQHGTFITAVPRQQEVWPGSASIVPRPSTQREQPTCPAARRSDSTCQPASGLAVGHDSPAVAHSIAGHMESGRVCRLPFAPTACVMGHLQKPGHSLPHVSIQPSLMAPHHGGGRGAGTPWEVLNEGGLLGSADAAVTVQLLPAVKSAVASNKPAEKAQVWRTELLLARQ